jgi:hypothetical protein
MHKKASTLVIFAIFGFVILVSGGFLYYVKDSSIGGAIESEAEKKITQQNDVMSIKYYIEREIQDTFIDGVIALLESHANTCILTIPSPHDSLSCGIVQGNYLEQPDPYEDDLVPIPAKYKYGADALFEGGMPYIETWISIYMERNLRFDYSDFEKMGYDISAEAPQVTVSLNLNDVGIEVQYPIKVIRDTSTIKMSYFKYIYNYDLYRFLTFIISMVKDKDTVNLFYAPTSETDYLVERIAGVSNLYDVIRVTDQNIRIGAMLLPLSFSFVRENRPSDANSVYFNSENTVIDKEHPLLYSKALALNCLNAENSAYFADPDEDDKYSSVDYQYNGWKAETLSTCGNGDATLPLDTNACDVCKDVTVTLTDSGQLKDMKFFQNFIVCNATTGDKNQCCGSDGCWKVQQQASCGPCDSWTTVETCTYQTCPSGCGATSTATAVTKEVLYAQWCTSCGDCECSNSIVLDTRSYSCPPDQTCPDCGGGGEEEPPFETGGGEDL